MTALPVRAALRILFAGSPAIALPALTMIAEGAKAGRWQLAGVLTNPDKPKGRSGSSTPTDVGCLAAALAHECTAQGRLAPALLTCETLKAAEREAVAALKPDLLVSFAYGRIFGPQFMAIFPLGGINVHPSLLPRYRGASPIQEAIVRRDTQTGVTIQRIHQAMDSGNILAQHIIDLDGTETTAALSETAGIIGSRLLCTVLEQFCHAAANDLKAPQGIPQEGQASYCSLISKESGIINWQASAAEIDAQIRACNPWPLACTSHNGQGLFILAAQAAPAELCPTLPADTTPGMVLGCHKKCGIVIQTGSGILAVSLLQYAGRKILPWQAFLNGARNFIGSRLGGL